MTTARAERAANRTSSLTDRALAERLNVVGDAQREGEFELADVILRQIIAECTLDELPIDALCPLTIRAFNAICNARSRTRVDARIATIGDLVRCDVADLRGWRNFGAVSAALLGERLRALGLNLAGQHDYAWIKPLPDQRYARRHDLLLLIPTYGCLPEVQPTNGDSIEIGRARMRLKLSALAYVNAQLGIRRP